MAKVWHINYNGWRITHDPYGNLACYRIAGDVLEWCYFGDTLAEIKEEIDRREMLVNMTPAYTE